MAAERGPDLPEPVALRELAPHVARQHRGRVEQHDAAHLRRRRGVEERRRAPAQLLHRVVGRHRGGHRGRRELALDLLVDRPEQLFLGREVVVERAACHAGALDDVLPPGRGEAPFREQRPGGGEQRGPGLLPALGLGAAVTSVTS